MFSAANPQRSWSKIGILVLIGSVIASVVLAILDGIFEGVLYSLVTNESRGFWKTLAVWTLDFRYLADQSIYASTIFTVGAKFIEMRTVLTVGFDKLDADRTAVKGPDDDNTVWIGHRYGTRFEAEAVASVFAERLKESAA
ncbi:MAG TPA: hypothetical protein VHU18_05675 [Rhizomicrobium sp.]|jgi:hypothetical protein|nr:hypothetical protein [Rhizomicrobium sp.]